MNHAGIQAFRDIIWNATILIVTALPGVQRIVAFWIIARTTDINTLGKLATDISLTTIFGFTTAIGWCSLMLVRLPRLRAARQSQFSVTIALNAFIVTVASALPLVYLQEAGIIHSAWGTWLLLASWSIYQLARHYSLARKEYGRLLAYEVTALCVSLSCLGLVARYGTSWAYSALSLPYLAMGLAWLCRWLASNRAAGLKHHGRYRDLWSSSQGFALNTGLTAGLMATVVPIAKLTAGDAHAGVAAIVLSVTQVLVLFPRALSYHFLVPMSAAFGERDTLQLKKILRRFRLNVAMATAATGIAAGLGWHYAGGFMYPGVAAVSQSLTIFTMLVLTYAASQLALPDSNLLMCAELARLQFAINLFHTLFYVLGFVIASLLYEDGINRFILILAVLLAGTCIRASLIAVSARKALE
ncbi:MAG: hypothetical protein HS110_01115 [Zoogloeaceae bacterium]|nr:hypothetical protein [Zoogloeaceae bacterium]